jgi:hypothetical protein
MDDLKTRFFASIARIAVLTHRTTLVGEPKQDYLR